MFAPRQYSLPNYTIGVNGKFDAVYPPKAKQLKVTVKVAFKFNGTWSKKQKDNYRNGYMWTIRNAWNKRYTFVNIASRRTSGASSGRSASTAGQGGRGRRPAFPRQRVEEGRHAQVSAG